MGPDTNRSLEHSSRSDALLGLYAFTKYLIPLQPRSKVAHFGIIKQQRGHLSAQYGLPEDSWKLFLHEPPTEAEVREWLKLDPEVNWAVMLGEKSKLMVAEEDGGKLPFDPGVTITAEARRGMHYYYHWQPALDNLKSPEDWELRVHDCYVVGVGSVHESGHVYRWRDGCSPTDRPVAALLADLTNTNYVAPPAPPATEKPKIIPVGARHNELLKVAGQMRRNGLNEPEIMAALTTIRRTRCADPKTLFDHDLRGIVEYVISKPSVSEGKPGVKQATGRVFPRISNLGKLDQVQFPPQKWVVDRLLPIGLSLLVGAPKVGKSWFALQLALMLGCSGFVEDAEPKPAEGYRVSFPSDFLGFQVAYGRVLYLALEDSDHRLQTRARALMSGALPDSVSYATEWNLLHNGGLEDIEAWVNDTPDVKLVILDTLGRLRKPTTSYSYDRDVHDLKDLHRLALDRDIGVMIVHHKRKGAEGDDFLETVSGTTAIAGTCDTILSLTRPRGDAVGALKATGRDIEEQSLAVKHNPDNGRWVNLGPLDEQAMSLARREYVELLEASGPLGPKEIAKALGKDESTVKTTLKRMVEAGEIKKPARGLYASCGTERESIEEVTNDQPHKP